MNAMRPGFALIPSAIIALLSFITPVTASLSLSDASYIPHPPLGAGVPQHTTATFYIGPSGATTFVKGHELQMQTFLVNARWNIPVLLNGRNTAQQSASGSAAIVNGEILSSSTNNDVSPVFTGDGVILQTPGDRVMVLRAEELDNSGTIVPGSVITLKPTRCRAACNERTDGPPHSHSPCCRSSLTKSPGFTPAAGILALGLAMGCIMARRDLVTAGAITASFSLILVQI